MPKKKIVPYAPLDVVRTPKGNIAVVVEVSGDRASIDFLDPDRSSEHNAWWGPTELVVIGNLVPLMVNAMAHDCGPNKDQGERYFTPKRKQPEDIY
jgi:hypothetical protein